MAGTAAMPAPSATDVYQHLSLPFLPLRGRTNVYCKKESKFTDPPGSLTTRPLA